MIGVVTLRIRKQDIEKGWHLSISLKHTHTHTYWQSHIQSNHKSCTLLCYTHTTRPSLRFNCPLQVSIFVNCYGFSVWVSTSRFILNSILPFLDPSNTIIDTDGVWCATKQQHTTDRCRHLEYKCARISLAKRLWINLLLLKTWS